MSVRTVKMTSTAPDNAESNWLNVAAHSMTPMM